MLKKHLLTHQRAKSKSNAKLEEVQSNFDLLSSTVKGLKNEIDDLKKSLILDEEHLDNLLIKRNQVEDNFKNSGGLLEGEKAVINSEIAKLETERTNLNQNIKDFCNDTLPFLLVADLLEETKIQIEREDSLNSYNSVKGKLSADIVKNVLSNHLHNKINEDTYTEIAVDLLNNMFNTSELKNVATILELSYEQKIL
ncbi:hypothetical protein [Clostridium ljungdahlii]|uniref:hypothetical protein n=1 Tax=Clostridium ljungdahlii TaxID=1538 RepID=UPI00386FC7C1